MHRPRLRFAVPVAPLLALLLAACSAARFDTVGTPARSQFYAEYCTLSQIKKRPGFGADIRGDIGGHSVFFLQGACLDHSAHYPVLRPCEAGGAGLSVNAHFSNAKWVATPGHDFFFEGGLPAGEAVTRSAYQAVQREAARLGVYDGVSFHEGVFDAMPAGWSRRDWMYEMSVGTDYAVGLARGRHCATVPVDRAAMARMIDFLNAENAPYRAGAVFHWDILADNCIHLAHNALAAAGLWAPWPTRRPLLVSMFDFPVPRNEFVNLARRTNDDIPTDPAAAFDDADDRRALLRAGELPARPGALALSRPPRQPNDVYETDGLKMIFYDEPNIGAYPRWSRRIFAEPRYTDPAVNRAFFAAFAHGALARQRPLADWLLDPRLAAEAGPFSTVYQRFYDTMERWAGGRDGNHGASGPGAIHSREEVN